MWSSRLLMDTTVTSVFHNHWTFKVLSFPMMDWHPSASKVIVSLMYLCEALNPCRSGFPNRASHAPLLEKISNVPCVWILPTTTIPVHVPSEHTRVPFAILRTFDECQLGESCFFMEWNILLSIAFTIPPSSNIALTLMSFPSIPIRSISFSNGMLAFPMVYSSWQSTMSRESYVHARTCSYVGPFVFPEAGFHSSREHILIFTLGFWGLMVGVYAMGPLPFPWGSGELTMM